MSKYRQLILIKHSLPEIIENIPAREWNLSEEGRIRAQKLAEKLDSYHPEVIVSSVEPKAQQTAAIIAERLGLKSVVMDGLHEHDRSGAPFYSKETFRSLSQALFKEPEALIFGNETGAQALGRFCKSVDTILELYKDKNVAIVSHGTVISLFVSWLTRIDGYSLWEELGLPSFVVIDVQNKQLLKIENIS